MHASEISLAYLQGKEFPVSKQQKRASSKGARNNQIILGRGRKPLLRIKK